MKSFRPGSNFRAWVFRIGHNNFVNQKRAGAADETPVAGRRGGPGPRVGRGDARRTARRWKLVAGRWPICRPTSGRRCCCGWRGVVVPRGGEGSGTTEETARWRVFKARQKLMKVLAPELLPPGAMSGEPEKASGGSERSATLSGAMNCQASPEQDPRAAGPAAVVPDALREHVVGCAGVPGVGEAGGAARRAARTAAGPARAGRQERCADRQPHPRRHHHHATRGRSRSAARVASAGLPPRATRRSSAGWPRRSLVALGAWALFPKPVKPEMAQPLPDDPFLRKIVQRDLALANAKTPAKRLQMLSGLADDLSAQARSLARVRQPDELGDLARWYDQVVKDAIVKQAERCAGVRDGPGRTGRARGDAQVARRETDETRGGNRQVAERGAAGSEAALQRMTESAREGQKKLQEEQKKLDTDRMRGKK